MRAGGFVRVCTGSRGAACWTKRCYAGSASSATPKINKNAGRDHWAACNTVLLAGAGIPGGQVYGASDRIAAYPARQPVSPADLSATIYHLLGIAPRTHIEGLLGQRLRLSDVEPLCNVI